MMDNIEKCKSLLEKLRATETLELRMKILQDLSNEDQFELDTYLCYGERTVEGTVCFPYRNGKYFNQKPTEKAPWIKNRFRDLDNLSIESVQKYDNYRTLNILNRAAPSVEKNIFTILMKCILISTQFIRTAFQSRSRRGFSSYYTTSF